MTKQVEVRSEVQTLELKDNIANINLDILGRTYLEVDLDDRPIFNQIQHVDLIKGVMELCDKHKLDYRVDSMFATQNSRKGANGIAVSKAAEAIHGTGAIEAHVLRRVFTTLMIDNLQDDETTTGLVIAYHQDGIQLAIGPNVKMCTNQCVLSAERYLTTYGENKVKDIDKMFQVVDSWLFNFEAERIRDQEILARMKEINTTYDDIMKLIGYMNAVRVTKDSTNKSLRGSNPELIKNYALNQGQISEFTEGYLLECLKKDSTNLSLYDVYNVATELYVPSKTDVPNIISQSIGWTNTLVNHFNL